MGLAARACARTAADERLAAVDRGVHALAGASVAHIDRAVIPVVALDALAGIRLATLDGNEPALPGDGIAEVDRAGEAVVAADAFARIRGTFAPGREENRQVEPIDHAAVVEIRGTLAAPRREEDREVESVDLAAVVEITAARRSLALVRPMLNSPC